MKTFSSHDLTRKIIIGMVLGFVLGMAINFGLIAPLGFVSDFIGASLTVGAEIFISSLKLLVVPLVFVSLVTGTASLDDVTKIGRIGGKTLFLYLFTTSIAVSIGLILASLVRPGAGFHLHSEQEMDLSSAPSIIETLIGLVPSNPVEALASANMLQIIVFSGLLGVAAAMAGESGKSFLRGFKNANDVVMVMVQLVMQVAPYGIFCLLAKVFAEQGFEAVMPLLKYFVVVVAALLVHLLITYIGLLQVYGRLNAWTFFKKFKEVPIFAFSTSSSGATIPINMEVVEKKLGVSNSIASFTIPLGATINMDGTAIMQGVATCFIAQAYGIELTLVQLLTVVATATLASIGTAAVPGVGLVTLAMVLKQVGLPVEGIGLIIGVDRLLDMMRTSINVTGDAVVSLLVAKSEGQLNLDEYNGKVKS